MLLFLFTVYMADDDNIEMKNKKRANIAKNKNRNQLSQTKFCFISLVVISSYNRWVYLYLSYFETVFLSTISVITASLSDILN